MAVIHFTPRQTTNFWARVDQSGGADACWPWTGGRFKRRGGYGRVTLNKKDAYSHRVAFALANLRTPSQCVLHKCDNPPCCNPSHLFEGTQADNVADCVAKGRTARGDKSGARLHPESVARGSKAGMTKHPESRHWGDRNGSRTHPERLPRGERNGSRTHPECVPRGERCGTARLTEQQAIEVIRTKGAVSIADLARKFGVSHSAISLIRRGINWKHLSGR